MLPRAAAQVKGPPARGDLFRPEVVG